MEPSKKIIVEITSGVRERSSEQVKDGAHQLKSAARTVGAIVLADTCVDLEAAGRDADWDTIERLSPRAAAQMEEVLKYIEAL